MPKPHLAFIVPTQRPTNHSSQTSHFDIHILFQDDDQKINLTNPGPENVSRIKGMFSQRSHARPGMEFKASEDDS